MFSKWPLSAWRAEWRKPPRPGLGHVQKSSQSDQSSKSRWAVSHVLRHQGRRTCQSGGDTAEASPPPMLSSPGAGTYEKPDWQRMSPNQRQKPRCALKHQGWTAPGLVKNAQLPGGASGVSRDKEGKSPLPTPPWWPPCQHSSIMASWWAWTQSGSPPTFSGEVWAERKRGHFPKIHSPQKNCDPTGFSIWLKCPGCAGSRWQGRVADSSLLPPPSPPTPPGSLPSKGLKVPDSTGAHTPVCVCVCFLMWIHSHHVQIGRFNLMEKAGSLALL